jgi:hypothetical protein
MLSIATVVAKHHSDLYQQNNKHMCKMIAISRIATKNSKQASALVLKMAFLLGASQKDGFGYSIKHQNGQYTERYLSADTVAGMGTLKEGIDMLKSNIKTKLVEGIDFDVNGVKPKKGAINGSIIAHGRTATCGKSIDNTHPFTGSNEHGTYTIAHNGVVEWTGEKLPLHTTCDSEHILNCFLHLNGEQSFKDGLAGYAAVVGFDSIGNMFVLRDNRAPLYMSYIVELDSYVICTDKTHCVELTKMLCDFNSIKTANVSTPMMLADYVKHVFQQNGEVTSSEFPKFNSSMSYASTASIYRSLGSAGASGYTGGYSGGYSPGTYKSYSPATLATPSTPSTEPEEVVTESEQAMLDAYHKKSMEQSKKNSRKQTKAWKDSDWGY